MEIEFKRLIDINSFEIIELMNNFMVRRQMPLLQNDFNQKSCDEFIMAKEELWIKHGIGPLAFVVEQKFAGWGGLQPFQEDVELAMVLHPNYWGIGKVIYHRLIDYAFIKLKLESITVLLPPTRGRINGLTRLGFYEQGVVELLDKSFTRYRLLNPYNQIVVQS